VPILSSIDANRTVNRGSLDCLSAECGNDREDRLLKKYGQRSAMSVVVSLFSEVDGDLEHDTLSVMGRDTMAGRDVWVVRFADPVITTRYLVDAKTRAILDAVTTQRKTGTRFYYAYPASSPAGREGGRPHIDIRYE
jgi:hypothetical protein